MKVKVRYLAVLRGLSKSQEKEVEFSGETLGDLVAHLRSTEPDSLKSRMFEASGALRPDIVVFINDADAALVGDHKALLREGDEVAFLPSVHGG